MKFYNYTNHAITIYNTESLQTDGRNNLDYFTIPDYEPVILISIPQSGRPLNSHQITGNLQSTISENIQIHHPLITSTIMDPFTSQIDPDGLYIVSSKYAKSANYLNYTIYDSLYVPDGRVYSFDDTQKKHIIGCVGLRKVAMYQKPSIYLETVQGIGFPPCLISIKCAINYWRQNYMQLDMREQNALNALEYSLKREVSVCH